jgi:PIN domain nuclease of toxin-antitoxin system
LNILLDTHFIIWLASDPARLTAHERDILSKDSNRIIASAVSIWEIRLKWASAYASGERKGVVDPIEALALVNSAGMSLLMLDAQTAATPLLVPITHKDPFDELLLVQAQQSGARLLTRDRTLLGHPLAYQPQ